MRKNEFLDSSPFTVARLKHEPETRVYKHNIALDGICVCPYMRAEPARIIDDTPEPEFSPAKRFPRASANLESIEYEISEMLRGYYTDIR